MVVRDSYWMVTINDFYVQCKYRKSIYNGIKDVFYSNSIGDNIHDIHI